MDKPRGARHLVRDLSLLALAGAVLVAGTIFGVRALYTNLYSPSAFVESYLTLLSEGRAADALVVPGVSIDSAELEKAGITANASDALLRRDALAPLTSIKIESEVNDGAITHVTASYVAGGVPGKTTFDVERNGWNGLAPSWRFARTPLGMIDFTVFGSMSFSINGFTVDKRQVSPNGLDAKPNDAIAMLVFAPGLYSVAVDTPVSTAKGQAVLADAPLTPVALTVQTQPTAEFTKVIQDEVNSFLVDQCATQEVLQPTNCPFGLTVSDRINSLPKWEMTQLPAITILPAGSDWSIPSVEAVATITVEMQSLYDGSTWERVEDVPFHMTGTIHMTEGGQASISITAVNSE